VKVDEFYRLTAGNSELAERREATGSRGVPLELMQSVVSRWPHAQAAKHA
jgi:hypothetical protein